MSDLLQISDLQYHCGDDGFAIHIKSLHIARGEAILLLGESGSGKSTLLNLIAGVLPIQTGQIMLAGQDLAALSPTQMDSFRGQHIGLIYQTFNLMPWLSVRDNILLGAAFSKQRHARISENRKQRVDDLLDHLNLSADLFANRRADRLSVGQQQRVAAARALLGQPDLILADEPSAALDDKNAKAFFELLCGGLNRDQQGLLVVSHDRRITSLFDRVIEMEHLIGGQA